MESPESKVLVIGYGNPGRLDDGLGPALADALAKLSLPGVMVDSNYQLETEDSTEVAKHECVVFADASVSCQEPFEFYELQPRAALSFSSHSIKAEEVLALSRDLFGKTPKAYMLSIRGYDFDEFGERLSPQAQTNLRSAVDFLTEFLDKCSKARKDEQEEECRTENT